MTVSAARSTCSSGGAHLWWICSRPANVRAQAVRAEGDDPPPAVVASQPQHRQRRGERARVGDDAGIDQDPLVDGGRRLLVGTEHQQPVVGQRPGADRRAEGQPVRYRAEGRRVVHRRPHVRIGRAQVWGHQQRRGGGEQPPGRADPRAVEDRGERRGRAAGEVVRLVGDDLHRGAAPVGVRRHQVDAPVGRLLGTVGVLEVPLADPVGPPQDRDQFVARRWRASQRVAGDVVGLPPQLMSGPGRQRREQAGEASNRCLPTDGDNCVRHRGTWPQGRAALRRISGGCETLTRSGREHRSSGIRPPKRLHMPPAPLQQGRSSRRARLPAVASQRAAGAADLSRVVSWVVWRVLCTHRASSSTGRAADF
ncbi:hypothetical protein Gobs_4727 [Geodermatophilus obscurus DSM 43160]|uniref:Uncharacterized protein n=1 Tax=Geodermatophilus obscurus (strain ATCC 25078 / DSM 43160 / JCM 3152 / CCUG 61914 / KCC A-0152 / KCTC 9177 / NBRC 13315 / NRRL B-3577 / G-20) TaxID=526225 RepID=D2S5L5_GEOOG|nr:hypothetical protein Gobs_4727 [Geodermatophilus obscurus DSM 43160]